MECQVKREGFSDYEGRDQAVIKVAEKIGNGFNNPNAGPHVGLMIMVVVVMVVQ